jgi:4-hydroxy-tetrahydrodipicolinate reductase
MKIAVIGTGKTGGEVLNILDGDQIVGPFNSAHPPTVEKLKPADVAVIFVPGEAVDHILDTVLSSGIAAAWGTTGYEWPHEKLDQQLKENDTKWMRASNFSLGMNIMRRCLQMVGKGSEMLDQPTFHIHEVHHTNKQDAPSGTAISWKKWLGKEADITSERRGDVKGIHQLKMETTVESIELKHRANDRAVFAEGALWAAKQLLNESVSAGFHTMETLFDQKMD